jgi:type VI protein secretion system component Hcp
MTTRRTSRIVRFGCSVALFLLIGASLGRAQGPISIYARFLDGTGVWAGESTKPGRTGWADLMNLAFGGENAVTIGGGGGGGTTARLSFDDVVLAKKVDRLTPQIFANLASGSSLNANNANGDVTFEFARSFVSGGNEVTFLRVEYRLVFFTKQGSSTSEGDDIVKDNVTMTAGATRITYWPILANGSQGTPIIKSWSVVLNNNTFNVN